MEASRYGPRLSALVGLLGCAFPLSISKTQALLDQMLGVEYSFGEVCVYSCGTIATIRQRLSAALAQTMSEALVDVAVSFAKLGSLEFLLSIQERRNYLPQGLRLLTTLKQAGRLHSNQDWTGWFDIALRSLKQ